MTSHNEWFHFARRADSGRLAQITIFAGDEHRIIADVECLHDYEEGLAHARLIAAAPLLAAELKSLSNEVSGMLSAFDLELRSVILNTNLECLRHALDKATAAIAKVSGDVE